MGDYGRSSVLVNEPLDRAPKEISDFLGGVMEVWAGGRYLIDVL